MNGVEQSEWGQAVQSRAYSEQRGCFLFGRRCWQATGNQDIQEARAGQGGWLATAGDAQFVESSTSRQSSDSESQTSTTRAMERVAGTEPARERETGSEVQTDGRAWRHGVSGTWLTPGVGPARCYGDVGRPARTPL